MRSAVPRGGVRGRHKMGKDRSHGRVRRARRSSRPIRLIALVLLRRLHCAVLERAGTGGVVGDDTW